MEPPWGPAICDFRAPLDRVDVAHIGFATCELLMKSFRFYDGLADGGNPVSSLRWAEKSIALTEETLP